MAQILGIALPIRRAATELGRWIGKSGHTLVYGGGESGLMGDHRAIVI